ncbi:hypothetical protein HMPREF0742_02167 [Rothia aeria F0184]|uniref:Uncharacterized protein n=1 Tax=Rothia aeria F0184 TaxID=888019 RepID=U7UZC8_9MICC|nr:hypothetical protein HMPREF0742_02167 [Rothia aeria F0184]
MKAWPSAQQRGGGSSGGGHEGFPLWWLVYGLGCTAAVRAPALLRACGSDRFHYIRGGYV